MLHQADDIELKLENGTCAIWNGDTGIIMLFVWLSQFSYVYNACTRTFITPPILFTIIIDRFGAWSTSGCREVVQDENHTVCECNQLGHFGILFVRR